jgi:1,6-anhydro-N-acetylmuramate kinase
VTFPPSPRLKNVGALSFATAAWQWLKATPKDTPWLPCAAG